MPEYSVRLVLKVAAESPEQAAPTFIAHMVENGLTDWVYEVCDLDADNSVFGYFDGFGLPVDVTAAATPAAPTPAPTAPEPAPVQTPVQSETTETAETDAELLALAQDLNDNDDTEQPAPTSE